MTGVHRRGKPSRALPVRHAIIPAVPTTTPQPPSYRQVASVETPEHVALDYEVAGLGSRALAAILDTVLVFCIELAVLFVSLAFGGASNSVFTALLIILSAVFVLGYFVLFEGLRGGQTPGKRRLGIRVVRDTGHPVTLGASVVRNLLRIADFLPPPYLIGGLFVALHPRAQRLGDLVAGTLVVRDRPAEAARASLEAAAPTQALGAPALGDEEFELLARYLERAPALEDGIRRRLAASLTARLAARYPTRPADDLTFLQELHTQESARRRGALGGKGTARSAFSARKRERWNAFRLLADRAQARGLDSFRAEELPDYAARYREVAADLARARTMGASDAVQAELERLVAAGHNSLYRDERRGLQRLWTFVIRDCPAAVVRAWRPLLLAALLFSTPGIIGFTILQQRPDLAEEVLPETMLRRAEAGLEGGTYFTAESRLRPVLAAAILTNNIRVAITCFAGGIFVGIGSLVLLAFNGLQLGMAFGHYANVGAYPLLLEFVIGHGVLEIFAIWIAGAAGFVLGRAILTPGRLRRGDALVASGRQALPMVGACVVLLVLAGLIEGFLSASEQVAGVRWAVSGASAGLLVLYLLNGFRYRRA